MNDGARRTVGTVGVEFVIVDIVIGSDDDG